MSAAPHDAQTPLLGPVGGGPGTDGSATPAYYPASGGGAATEADDDGAAPSSTQDNHHNTNTNAFWSVYDTPTLQHGAFDWKSPVFTVLAVAGASGEAVSLPLWIGAFGHALGGPYFILLFASLCFALVFAAMAALHWARFRCEWAPLRQHWLVFVLIGVLDGANGLLLVYASPAARTPPLLQALLPSCGILFAIGSTRLLVKKRDAPISFTTPLALLSLFLLLAGLVVSLFPLLLATIRGETAHGRDQLVWSLVFALAILPGSVYNVLQEKFLKERKRSEKFNSNRSRFFDITVMLFWGCLFQLLTIVVFFWVDSIKGYGFAANPGATWSGVASAFTCIFNADNDAPLFATSNCPQVAYLGAIFIGGYFMAYLAGSALNESSAAYNVIATTMVSPVAATFWLVFPQLNTSKSGTPVAVILPALALVVLGSVLWRLMENKQKRAHLGPAARQSNLPAVERPGVQ